MVMVGGVWGTVSNCPIKLMTATLTSVLPASAALKSGPSGILFTCAQILWNKHVAGGKHAGLTIARSCTLIS